MRIGGIRSFRSSKSERRKLFLKRKLGFKIRKLSAERRHLSCRRK